MNPSNQVLLNPDFLINNLVTDCRKVQNSSDGLKRRRVKVLTANKIKDKYKKLEKHKKRVIKEWKNQYINSLTIYPFSSPMGQRVAHSLKSECFDNLKVESMVRKYEIYCSLKIRHREKAENKLNKWKPRNIERLTTGLELSQRSHAMGFHQYSFTRRQRLEKLKRTETGIDWKSRITAFTCNPNVQVMVPKLYWCPICSKTIEVDHSCDMSAKCDMNSSKVPILNLSSNGLSQQMVLRGDNKRRNNENLAQNAHEICHKKHKKLSPKKSPKVCRIDLNEED
ncbi:unnamed protein product [Oppiella nova]|uniref:Uncharacterized protein n=1 Tax=Oppiella nova TaxID=334625 RepID=A0A7R9MEH1_9ACAR|nr:unnamed protein product [Oppiella nova]CAG2175834.1 unnamed protein product [Oppiella nova]